MGLPIKVFILGSCVSRDPFEIADNRDFDVVAYYARSSFASLGAEPYLDKKILSGVKSNWQRRMVRADMEKSVFSALEKTDFDVLLIDLIDERFSCSVKGSSVHTISTEYKKALYKPNLYGFIKAGSEEKLTLWREGLERISRYLVKHGLDDKVIVNQVYWSLRCQHPEKLLDRYSEDQIKKANEQLDWMYEEIKKTLPKAKFIAYSDEDLEIDEQHKWGMEPFHYSRRAFVKQLSFLNKITSDIKMTFSNRDFEDNFMYEQCRPSSVEETKELARSFLFSQDLRLEYKISSLVVYVYKCIETRDVSGVQEAEGLGREWLEKLEERLSITNKGIREDPVQVALSYYTAMWHASVFLENSPVVFLEKVRCLVSDFDLVKASYSQNIGRALLLLSYIRFNGDEKDESKKVILKFYEYFIRLFGSLKPSSPVGSSHFGDMNKCANALQCALGGLEWIENKRYRKSLWSEGKVFQLTSRINDAGFKEKFLKQFSSSGGESGVVERLVCVGIRYSLFQPGTSHYHISSSEREKYKNNLFSDGRLNARYEIFRSVTLPSLRKLNCFSSDSFMVVMAISKEMPDGHKEKLLDLVGRDGFIRVVEQDEGSADINKAMKLAISERMAGKKCLVSTVRLDDDDALSIEWLTSLSEFLKFSNIGKAYTFPKGLTAFFDSDENKFIGVVENYSKGIGLGLAHVTYFDGKHLQHESVYSQGDHLNVPAEVVETDDYSYLRVINSFRDKNYKAGSQKDRLRRDFFAYLSRSSRAFVSLENYFWVSTPLEELDVFFAAAEKKHDCIDVVVHEGTLSERFCRYAMACYFYSGGSLVEKVSYRAGPKLSVYGSKYLEVDQVKVYIKNVAGDRHSVKIPVR